MTLRRGESLLLTLGIPVVLLVFFSEVHLLPTGTAHPVTFLAPGVLALAVMGTAMVNLSIATGFERGYGVLKRLGATPLGRPSLLGAKIASILVVEVLQVAVLVPSPWRSAGTRPPAASARPSSWSCWPRSPSPGSGLFLAGVLRAEVNLAAANALWLLLLLVSGMLAPLSKLPGWLEAVAKVLPAAALSEALHATLGLGVGVPGWAWVVLVAWAVRRPARRGVDVPVGVTARARDGAVTVPHRRDRGGRTTTRPATCSRRPKPWAGPSREPAPSSSAAGAAG